MKVQRPRYDFLLFIAGIPWLFNFKIKLLGDVYFSFLVDLVLFSFAFIFIVMKGRGRLIPLWAVFVSVLIVLHSIILRFSGLSTAVDFDYAETLPIGHYIKVLVFGLVFFVYYDRFSKGKENVQRYINTYQLLIGLTLIKYWFLYVDKITLVREDNLDLGRVYPEWIGGWNAYAMLISFAIIFSFYWAKSSFFNRAYSTVLWITLISTQSRGGFWFVLIALLAISLLSKNYEIYIRKFTTSKIISVFIIVGVSAFVVYNFGNEIVSRFFGSFVSSANPDIAMMQSVTSGRTVQWLDLFVKLGTDESVFQYFFGYGFGHYAWRPVPDRAEIEVHNMYLQFLYDFGIPLGLACWYFMYAIYARCSFKMAVRPLQKISKALAVVIVLSAVVQGIVLSTQTAWLVATIIALILSNSCMQQRSSDA